MFFLTDKTAAGILLSLLPSSRLDDDAGNSDLTAAGWRYAQFDTTGARVLVRSKGNSRWLCAWGDLVTDFEVRHVETVATNKGVIVTAMGEPHRLQLYTLTSNL